MSVREAVQVGRLPWSLECSSCGRTRAAGGLAGVCDCGQPYLVRYASAPPPDLKSLLAERDWTMWRYREWLPLSDGEQPRSEEHTSALQSRRDLVCRLLLEKK